ncbi:flagellin [Geothrix sp. 21YS21S-4]|uniref:flagellin n=1 Tax=Geothrix sp. 21YS21S-4 TaxID=3068889 RepID=UPI0027B993C5|nr:flagellin [Geothrix sp. 21YS21S-4]
MPSILNNVAALQSTRQLGITASGMKATIERLTTGKRINHASDDAAGLATATTLDADSRIASETRKTNNNTYYAASAEDGYMEEATNLVQRAVELAAGGNGSSAEFTQVASLAAAAFSNASAYTGGQTISTISDAATAKTALSDISSARSNIAATMAQAQSDANLNGIKVENYTAQKSNIMDADIGSEVVNLTKWQILSQAGTSALGQANQASQYVLSLLR